MKTTKHIHFGNGIVIRCSPRLWTWGYCFDVLQHGMCFHRGVEWLGVARRLAGAL